MDAQACDLLEYLADKSDDAISWLRKPTINDTTWIAMLCKPTDDGSTSSAFPESFQILLDCQQAHGGWSTCESKVDEILSTLAATVALKRHWSGLQPTQVDIAASLDARLSGAVAFLHRTMSDWEPEVGAHVGMELLVPTLLSMLEHENVRLPRFSGSRITTDLRAHAAARKRLLTSYSPLLPSLMCHTCRS